MKKYVKVFEMDPNDVNIHELASINPIATKEDFIALKKSIALIGQTNPVIMFKGFLIDGRHRLKAIKELGIGSIKYINEPSTKTLSDIEDYIMGTERRRHQTPTQKAISALRYYNKMKSSGQKISQGEVAEKLGTTRFMLGRAKTLSELTGQGIMDTLFNGEKILVNGKTPTDSLLTLINHFKTVEEDMTQQKGQVDLTDDEIAYVKEHLENISSTHNKQVIRALANGFFKLTKQ